MSVKFEWKGPDFVAKIKKGVERFTEDVGRSVLNRLRKNISYPNNEPSTNRV